MTKLIDIPSDKAESYPVSSSETERLSEVQAYDILETLPEKEFDSLVELAAIITDSPISLMNILDKNRQWTKAKYGLETDQEIPRSESICTYTILDNDNLEIKDLTKDSRFKNKDYVDGAPYFKFYSGYPLRTPSGHNIGALCVLDTETRELSPTQRKALKTIANEIIARLEIRKNQKELEKLNREKDHFLRAVNHDIKSPINGIVSSTHYLQNHWDGNREELNDILSMIELSGHKLINYTSELVFNSLEDGESRLIVDDVHADELVKDLIHIYTPLAKAKGIQIITSFDTPGTFRLDNEKFKLIVSNLISNALKFCEQGDTITLALEIIKEESRELHCTVSDTGIGIPEEFLPTLFEKKKEHQRKGTQGEISTGLGLPIIKQYIELHQGEVTVQSKEGVGTTIHISIPGQP